MSPELPFIVVQGLYVDQLEKLEQIAEEKGALTALAGPAANLVLAYLAMVGWKLMYYWAPANQATLLAATFLQYMVSMNVGLAVFNLLPVPPLDGSRILLVALPQRIYFGLMRYERVILVVMLAAVWSGFLDAPLY